MIITRTKPVQPLGGKHELCARVYPNGEAIVWPARFQAMEGMPTPTEDSWQAFRTMMCRMHLAALSLEEAKAFYMGLSNVSIFDRVESGERERELPASKVRARKGLKGLSPHGGRMVRNAIYTLERRYGSTRMCFSTVTLPALPRKQVRRIQENWGKVTEIFRLNIKRMLEAQNLSAEIVTVSEIQEKRYQKTGLPYLHLHSVFMGVLPSGRFAISIEQHDIAWYRAINSVVNINRSHVASACNLQRCFKSPALYLSKYLSKSVKSIETLVENGFIDWLPHHWYNCTRSLSADVRSKTRRVDSMAQWLDEMAKEENGGVWKHVRMVSVDSGGGNKINVALVGWLSDELRDSIHGNLTPP